MPSHKSLFKLVNHTDHQATLAVHDIDNFDWDGGSRPDHNLQGQKVKAHGEICAREELNANSTAQMFTLQLDFDHGKKLALRIDQGIAIGHTIVTKPHKKSEVDTKIADAAGAAAGAAIGGAGGALLGVVGALVGMGIAEALKKAQPYTEKGSFNIVFNTDDHYTVYPKVIGDCLEVHVHDV